MFMMSNSLYNLMLQCVQEQKSLWRIQKHYIDDAQNDGEERSFWEKMAEDKKEHIAEILELIKKEMG